MVVDDIINKIYSFDSFRRKPSAILINPKLYNEIINHINLDGCYTYPSNNVVSLTILGVPIYRTNDVEIFKVI